MVAKAITIRGLDKDFLDALFRDMTLLEDRYLPLREAYTSGKYLPGRCYRRKTGPSRP
jgi:hypothetical protein